MTANNNSFRADGGEETDDTNYNQDFNLDSSADGIPDQMLTELTYGELELQKVITTLRAVSNLPSVNNHEPTAQHLREAERHLYEAEIEIQARQVDTEAVVGRLADDIADSITITGSGGNSEADIDNEAAEDTFDEPIAVEADVGSVNLDDLSITDPTELTAIARDIVNSEPEIESIDELVYYAYSKGAQTYHTNPECHAVHNFVVTHRHPIKIAHESDRIMRRNSNIVIEDECHYCRNEHR